MIENNPLLTLPRLSFCFPVINLSPTTVLYINGKNRPRPSQVLDAYKDVNYFYNSLNYS